MNMKIFKLNIKHIFLIFAFLLSSHNTFAQYWELIKGTPTDGYKMACDANGNLWVATNNGDVYLYNGTSWQPKDSVGGHISAIAVAPNGDIYVGSSGILYKSTNGGNSWSNVFAEEYNPYIYQIVTSPSGAVYFANNSGGVYRQDGNSWTKASSGLSTYVVFSLAVAPNGTIYAGVGNVGVYRSTDNGVTWLPPNNFTNTYIGNIAVVDNNTIFAAADRNGILKSTDGGQIWTQCHPIIPGLNTFAFDIMYNSRTRMLFADLDGYAFDGCNALVSTDLGRTWEVQNYGLGNAPGLGRNSFAFDSSTGETYLKGSSFNYNNSIGPVYRYVTTGTRPTITIEIEPRSINFGVVRIGDSLKQFVNIKNTGNASLAIFSFAISPNVFILPNGESSMILQPGANHTLTVQFTPTDNINYDGWLSLTHNANGSPTTILLSGTGKIFNVAIRKDYRVKPNETIKISVDAVEDLTDKNAKDFLFTLKYNKRILSYKGATLSGTLSNSLDYFTEGSTHGELNVRVTNTTGEPLSATGSLIDLNFMGLIGDSCGTNLILDSFAFNPDGPNAIAEDGYCELFGRCGGKQTYVTSERDEILYQNNPNPIRGGYESTIQYRITTAGQTNLTIYDVLGREVTKLVNEYKSEGIYSINFNTKNLPSGVYFYKLRAPGYEAQKKMLIIR